MHPTIARTLLTLLPKRTLSDAAYWLTRRRPPSFILDPAINVFSKAYAINTGDVSVPPGGYKSFDEFFTRQLVKGARPIDATPDGITSPADGAWAAFGNIENLNLHQIKGKQYSLAYLLGSESRAEAFEDGRFATIYLSPRDYHRVHFPCDGEVIEYHYIPGELFPVNRMSVNSIPHLFSRNERMITYIDTPRGLVAVVMVAATCVSAITPSFDAHPPRFTRGDMMQKALEEPVPVKRGEELGIFHMGSTVVMVFPTGSMEFGEIRTGQHVLMGRSIGRWK